MSIEMPIFQERTSQLKPSGIKFPWLGEDQAVSKSTSPLLLQNLLFGIEFSGKPEILEFLSLDRTSMGRSHLGQ